MASRSPRGGRIHRRDGVPEPALGAAACGGGRAAGRRGAGGGARRGGSAHRALRECRRRHGSEPRVRRAARLGRGRLGRRAGRHAVDRVFHDRPRRGGHRRRRRRRGAVPPRAARTSRGLRRRVLRRVDGAHRRRRREIGRGGASRPPGAHRRRRRRHAARRRPAGRPRLAGATDQSLPSGCHMSGWTSTARDS